MSVEISWIAVAAPSADVHAHLDLEDTGEPVVEGGCEVAGAVLPHGGTLVVMNEFWHPWIQPDALLAWSKEARVLGCSASERTNASTAFLYRAGALAWQVSHVLDEGTDHFEVVGMPPRERQRLLERAVARRAQTGGDTVFDVPAQIAALECGWRHGLGWPIGLTRLRPRRRLAKGLAAVRGWAGRAATPAPPPDDRDVLKDTLMEGLGRTLAPLGFSREPMPHGGYHWMRDDGRLRLEVFMGTYGFAPSITTDTFVFVYHHALDRLLRAVQPHRGDKATGDFALSALENRRSFQIESAFEAKQHLAFVARTLPPLLAQCADFAALARLYNQGRREMSEFDPMDAPLSLALAWLTGNPHFEAMLAEADQRLQKSPEDPRGRYQRLADLLRRAGPPGAMRVPLIPA